MGFTVRQAEPADAAMMSALWESIKDEPYSSFYFGQDPPRRWSGADPLVSLREQIRQSAESEYRNELIAFAEDQAIGFLHCGSVSYAAFRHAAYLLLFVHRTWRRHGVGRALLQQGIDWAQATGFVERISLRVLARNVAAIRLYESFGFVMEACHRGTVRMHGVLHDEYSMVLHLERDHL